MDPVDEEISAFRKELKSQTVSILKELKKQIASPEEIRRSRKVQTLKNTFEWRYIIYTKYNII